MIYQKDALLTEQQRGWLQALQMQTLGWKLINGSVPLDFEH